MYTEDDTRDIWYGDHPDFDSDPVHETEDDETRWSLWSTKVYRHKGTGEHWSVQIGRGKTEMQEDEVYDPPKRVELREVPTGAKTVTVTLPTGQGPLADWLDANGHKEAAQAVRGFVLEWVPVEAGGVRPNPDVFHTDAEVAALVASGRIQIEQPGECRSRYADDDDLEDVPF